MKYFEIQRSLLQVTITLGTIIVIYLSPLLLCFSTPYEVQSCFILLPHPPPHGDGDGDGHLRHLNMATAAVSLLHFTRIPRHFSLFPLLVPRSLSSLSFRRSCKPRLCSSLFCADSRRHFAVTASSSSGRHCCLMVIVDFSSWHFIKQIGFILDVFLLLLLLSGIITLHLFL